MAKKFNRPVKYSNVILNHKSEFGRLFIQNHGDQYNIYPMRKLSLSRLNFRIESVIDGKIIMVNACDDFNKDFTVKFQ